MSGILAVGYLIGIVSVIDAVRRPQWQWAEADRDKGWWIGMLLVGAVFGPLSLVTALAYVIGVLPRMATGSEASQPFLKH